MPSTRFFPPFDAFGMREAGLNHTGFQSLAMVGIGHGHRVSHTKVNVDFLSSQTDQRPRVSAEAVKKDATQPLGTRVPIQEVGS